jgi:hypothetical protein
MQLHLLVVDLAVDMVQIILLHHQEVLVAVAVVVIVFLPLVDQELQGKETMAVMGLVRHHMHQVVAAEQELLVVMQLQVLVVQVVQD